MATKTLPIINKIATCIDKKYGISLKDYYQPTPSKTTLSLAENGNGEINQDRVIEILSNYQIIDKKTLKIKE